MDGNINNSSSVAEETRRRGRGAAVLVGLLACSAVVWQSSHAVFSDATENNGNVLGAGTVTIDDNDGGAKLFELPDLAPGATGSVCMGVSYTGSLTPTAIKMYLPQASALESDAGGGYSAWADNGASEMDDNTTLQIEVSSADLAADPGNSCAFSDVGIFGNVVAATNLRNLIATNNTYANGLTAPTIAKDQWRAFRFTYNFSSAAPNGAQGDGIQFGVTWEAQR